MTEKRIDKVDMLLSLITKGLNDPRFVPGEPIVFTIDEIIQMLDNEYEHGLRRVIFCKDCGFYDNGYCVVNTVYQAGEDNYCSWAYRKAECEDA